MSHVYMGFVLENLNVDPSILKNQNPISVFHDLRTWNANKMINFVSWYFQFCLTNHNDMFNKSLAWLTNFSDKAYFKYSNRTVSFFV